VESRYVCVDWAQFCNKLGIINVKRASVASMGFLDNGDSQAGANLGFEKVALFLFGCNVTITRRGTFGRLMAFPKND
jgi:hypothetical protein